MPRVVRRPPRRASASRPFIVHRPPRRKPEPRSCRGPRPAFSSTARPTRCRARAASRWAARPEMSRHRAVRWDFGRGVWPYRAFWNGASPPAAGERTIGSEHRRQVDDRYRRERRALCIAGQLQINEDLVWDYDRTTGCGRGGCAPCARGYST
jgi:hypothetical protein